MRKRILGILTAVLALSMVFSMINCDNGSKNSSTFSITYAENGWTGGGMPKKTTIAKNTAIGNKLVTLNDTADQIFFGWALSATSVPIEASRIVESDITLYVRWEAVVPPGQNITIKYEANDWTGTSPPANKTFKSGDALTAAELPSYSNTSTQIFFGWSFSQAGVTVDTTYKPKSNITLYVRWEPVKAVGETITITYNANGWTGTGVPANTTGTSGTALTAAQLPKLTDTSTQEFVGWATRPDGAPITALTPTSNIILYVIWEKVIQIGDPITITYNANGWAGGGVPATPGAGVSGSPIGAAALPDLTTYNTATQTFVGWALTADADAEIVTATLAPTRNITLYVIYTTQARMVTVTFNLNYEGAAAPTTRQVEEGVEVGGLPNPARTGYVFLGWYDTAAATGGSRYDATYRPLDNVTMYARWALDIISGEDADELLYLTNGAHAVYAFEIPDGHTLAEYDTLTVDYKITQGGAAAWNEYGARAARLYGVYTDTTPVSTANNSEEPYNQPEVLFFNISGSDGEGTGNAFSLNNGYILDNTRGTNQAGLTALRDAMKAAAEADEWLNVTYDVTGGAKFEDYNMKNIPGTQTGTVYFAIGLACQNLATYPNASFIQLVKDIKLLPKEDVTAPEVSGTKPPAGKAQFLANNDPIVYEWRAEPTADNIANWRNYVPYVPESNVDRGDPPPIEDLREVILGEGSGESVFTYLHSGGNFNNQRGWVSFGEAGRADSQVATNVSSVSVNNFKNAWYLVLETTRAPSGELNIVWLSGLPGGGWISALAVANGATTIEGVSEISGDDDVGYVIKIFLPNALAQYGRYFNDITEWAGLALSYWGSAPTANLVGIDITKAYLLVDKDEVEGPATGLSLALSFKLTNAPAGGDLLDDPAIEDDNLVIKAVDGLTDHVWYVNGTKNGETGDTLTIPAVDSFVTLQAKRDGKWASQAVYLTVSEE